VSNPVAWCGRHAGFAGFRNKLDSQPRSFRIMRNLLLTAALLSIATPALAEENRCAPYEQVEGMLASEYRETKVAQGIGDQGKYILAVFASPNGETWSAVLVSPDGTACLVDAGTDWQARKAPVPEQGS
jgi:hypothetical protein